jgi:hypothetical protein
VSAIVLRDEPVGAARRHGNDGDNTLPVGLVPAATNPHA